MEKVRIISKNNKSNFDTRSIFSSNSEKDSTSGKDDCKSTYSNNFTVNFNEWAKVLNNKMWFYYVKIKFSLEQVEYFSSAGVKKYESFANHKNEISISIQEIKNVGDKVYYLVNW